jgi:hypothetical protein
MSSEAQSQYARLLAALEDSRWTHMRILADAAEDEGNATLAAGWRWLADNKRWPRVNYLRRQQSHYSHYYEWEAVVGDDAYIDEGHALHVRFRDLIGRLPNYSFQHIGCEFCITRFVRLPLLEAAALAAGEWLQSQKKEQR